MKFITVRDFRTYPKKIWKELLDIQEMIVTNNGKPIALLTPPYRFRYRIYNQSCKTGKS